MRIYILLFYKLLNKSVSLLKAWKINAHAHFVFERNLRIMNKNQTNHLLTAIFRKY